MPKNVTVGGASRDIKRGDYASDYECLQAALDQFKNYDFTAGGGGVSNLYIYPEGSGTNGEWQINPAGNPNGYTGLYLPTGTTTSSGSYLCIRPAVGYSFNEHADKLTNPLRYNSANGVAIKALGGNVFEGVCQYVTWDGLQMHNPNQYGACVYASSGLYYATVRNCILYCSGPGAGYSGFGSVSQGQFKIINNVFLDARCAVTANGNDVVIGNTILLLNDAYARSALAIEWGAALVIGNIVSSNDATDITTYNASFAAGSGYNAVSDASGPATGAVQNLNISDLFESLAGGSEDLRLKSTCPSSVKTGGIRRQSDTNDLDVLGQSRSVSTPSIGAFEYQSAVTQVPPGIHSPRFFGFNPGFGR